MSGWRQRRQIRRDNPDMYPDRMELMLKIGLWVGLAIAAIGVIGFFVSSPRP